MQLTAISTEVQMPPVPFGALGKSTQATYPVRELWYLPDAIAEAEQVAEAWQETAYVYRANCYDGERNWLVYDVTTATGIAAMQIDASRVVACRTPEAVEMAMPV